MGIYLADIVNQPFYGDTMRIAWCACQLYHGDIIYGMVIQVIGCELDHSSSSTKDAVVKLMNCGFLVHGAARIEMK